MTSTTDRADTDDLRLLLEYLKQSRGFDFAGYKRASLERRLRKRMAEVRVETYSDYQDFLEVTPDEFTELFNTILINVTGFFRDRPAWDYLAAEVVPRLLADTPEGRPLRVWSAACASGEEAYTAAIVLAEALGDEEFRRRVKIYATDVDEDALATARQAVYSADALKAVPEELQKRYFDPNTTGFAFRPDLRRRVIFGRNDLVQDAPISRTDLLISRNALMYFTPETQARILSHFNYSLNDSGYMFLGKSEMLLTHSDLFAPHDLKWRIFKKVPRSGRRERLVAADAMSPDGDELAHRYAQIRDGAADMSPIASLVVDRTGFVAFVNQAARTLFNLGPADIGRPLQDLEVSYRPLELRAGLEQTYEQRRVVNLGRTRWRGSGDARLLDVEITPLFTNGSKMLGASITFDDVTAQGSLEEEYRDSKRQLEAAYDELQSTVEELETTNEELQSTNEELETTNEELQSTNEELETMNEELQSTNDELEAMNDEQRERAAELDRLNLFLEGILGNLGVGVVVLDREQHVQLWNKSAATLWGLQEPEVAGRHFLSLDIGLPVDELRETIRASMSAEGAASDLTLSAVNRRGRNFACHVRALPLVRPDGNHYGVILLMSDQDGQVLDTGPPPGSGGAASS